MRIHLGKDGTYRQQIFPVGASNLWVDMVCPSESELLINVCSQMEEKTVSFQRFALRIRKKFNFNLSMIGHADQTSLTFDIASNTTFSEKGVKSVLLLTTGHEKDKFTMMLVCDI